MRIRQTNTQAKMLGKYALAIGYLTIGLILTLGLALLAKKINVVEWLMRGENEETNETFPAFFWDFFFAVIFWPIAAPVALLVICAAWVTIKVKTKD